MLFSLVLLTAALGNVLSASTPILSKRGYAVKEEAAVPRGWARHHERLDKSQLIPLKIGLVQQNLEKAESLLYEISNPQHRNYGQHMSVEQIKDLLAPAQESVDRVMGWLASHEISTSETERVGDFIHVLVPIHKAEAMLDTEYNTYHSQGSKVVRALRYSLPFDLHEHVDLIQPTTMFGSLHKHSSKAIRIDDSVSVPKTRGSPLTRQRAAPFYGREVSAYNVTISSLRNLYNIGKYTATNASTSVAIASYLEQYANYEDYLNFTSTFAPYNGDTTWNVTSINEGLNNQTLSEAGDEADLDVQYAFGMVGSVPSKTVFTTGGRPPWINDLVANGTDDNEPYLDFLNYVLAKNYTTPLPQVISTSYGDDEQSVPKSYAQRVCTGFMTLGLLGTSVIFSSGDSGVGPGGLTDASECKGNIPGTPQYNQTIFLPEFPASCPYVTGVGGTTRQDPEVAVEILSSVASGNSTDGGFFSGGGFSSYFARPSYQNAQVEAYLPSINSTYNSSGYYNPAGRGIPDVAAQSWRFQVFIAGNATFIGGTSAASPTFAGIITLLNDVRLNAGLPTLGFLNPLLYGLQNITNPAGNYNGTGLNDVTIGSNPGCATSGFPAAPGWDAVTGLGTPNFVVLVQQLTLNVTSQGFLNVPYTRR